MPTTKWLLIGAAILTLNGLNPPVVEAWGNDGHLIVCEIAWRELTPQGRDLAKTILADRSSVTDPFDDCPSCQTQHPSDGRFMTFQQGCIWADESRRDTFKGTYEYHFINVVDDFADVVLERDCAAQDCAVVGIQRFARYVAQPPRGDRERERRFLGLRFLSHFVGDLHQPLHVGFTKDTGGNGIGVRWFGADTNLHSVWDSSILNRGNLTAGALHAEITDAERNAWRTFDIMEWAEESFDLARTSAYRKPGGGQVEAGDALSDAYYKAGLPIVREQLKKAGVRLAHLINAAASGALPLNLLN